VSRSARQRRSGAGRANCSADFIDRSTATQAMTLLAVKSRAGPRISHLPLSGCD